MGYTILGIANIALGRIGVARLSAWPNTTTPQGIAANDVWEYIRDEVLEAKEWRFAKTRDKLGRAPVSPMYTYDYAYVLPADYLRLAKGTIEDPAFYPISNLQYKFETLQLPEGLEKIKNGAFAADTDWTKGTGWTIADGVAAKAAGAVNTLSQPIADMVSVPVVGESYQLSFDLVTITGGALMPQVGGAYGSPVSDARVHSQIIEATSVTSGVIFIPMDPDVVCTIDDVSLFKVADRLCVVTDYEDSEDDPIYITYIKRATDVSKYPPSFINALAWRLAGELAINLPESRPKLQDCKDGYELALLRAEEGTQAIDQEDEEKGNSDWETAGR